MTGSILISFDINAESSESTKNMSNLLSILTIFLIFFTNSILAQGGGGAYTICAKGMECAPKHYCDIQQNNEFGLCRAEDV
ncbi:unnamed protein product [Caenorhabditis angaria]|uniref:Uncharacterized protein n=1 Tax=Caenorhabditis angaria TaxID=860376 RepID=A0A9P1IRZ2_9PELO|nr:unnamed protein product [Caenorhabditis angaria]